MSNQNTRIVFTGDIAFSRYFSDGWKDGGCLDESVLQYLGHAEHIVANVECPLTLSEIESARPLNHAADPRAGAFLARNGITVWCLANNHILDCEPKGLLDTLRCAEENNCVAIGAGKDEKQAAKPVILGEGVKVGVISIAKDWPHVVIRNGNPGAFTMDRKSLLAKVIAELRKTVDWVVIMAHNGDEYCSLALPYIRERYLSFLEMGADIVIGHHPHVVQQYETVGKKLIAYSLGNFIFDTEHQRRFEHTDTGMLLGINFGKDSFTFDGFPTCVNREKHIVEKGTIPAIFQNVPEEEYQKLWPLSARTWYPLHLKNHKTLSKRKIYRYKFLVSLLNIYLCKKKDYRIFQTGRVRSLLGEWKKSSLQDVVKYLKS